MLFLTYLYILVPAAAAAAGTVLFVKRRSERQALLRALDYALYEVTLPQEKPKEGAPYNRDAFKEPLFAMAKLYAGLAAARDYAAFEIGLPERGNEIVFFAAVPKTKGDFFEKQLQGIFPHAQTKQRASDYNVFRPEGEAAAAVATLKAVYMLPLRTFDNLEKDPLAVIMNAFSKLKKEGEGASLQVILTPADEYYSKRAHLAARDVANGMPVKKALRHRSIIHDILKEAWHFVFGYPKTEAKDDKVSDQTIQRLLEAKAAHPIVAATVRLVASAEDRARAEAVLAELEGAFSQFAEPQGNALRFRRPTGADLKDLLYRFSFRLPDFRHALYLTTVELATLFHFPVGVEGAAAPQLKYAKTKEAAPPPGLAAPAAGGVLLGKNIYRGAETPVHMADDDRRRHLYVIGQTGTGKSTLLKNMIAQDIEAGRGVCFIDPHGSDLLDILSRVPPSREKDVVYFNPGDVTRPMGLNMLEYDPRYPEQKTFVVNELLGIFNKLFDMKLAGGPMFEQYFRNATNLVMDDPASGNTLFEVVRVLSDKNFRDYKLARTTNPVVISFWRDVAEQAGGEGALKNVVPYVTSKFDNFLSNEIMRPIIGQEKSAFSFREVMDEEKILLVNLSKGRLGDLNSSLLGLIIVGKLLMASLSRVDMPEGERKDFYLYIDEFQNVTTNSIATILSEARKYRLDLVIAHQFIGQLQEEIKKAVFGNAGSMAVFRVGAEDAAALEKQMEPVFNAQDIMNIDNFNAYLKLLMSGQTTRPFNIVMYPFVKGPAERAAEIIAYSSAAYGRPREEVEAEIRKKYSLSQSGEPASGGV